jgi:hypothetical protein
MGQSELLEFMANVLETLGIPYFVTGSVASAAWGEPRFTNDIDIVVRIESSQTESLITSFPDSDFYVSRSAAEEAVRRRRMFNIIHFASGLKVDLVVASDSEFDRERMARVRSLPAIRKRMIPFASPEDVILKKMLYFREGSSEKHLRDIGAVLTTQGNEIDRCYLDRWVAKFQLEEIWSLVLKRLEEAASEADDNSSN